MNVAETAAATAAAEAAAAAGSHAVQAEGQPAAEILSDPMQAAGTVTEPVSQANYEFIPEKTEKTKKKGKGWIAALIAAVLLIGAGTAGYFLLLKPAGDYKAAEALMAEGRYEDAIDGYEALGDYKDAPAKIDACLLQKALGELKNGKYSRAVSSLKNISDKELDLSSFRQEAESAFSGLLRTAAPSEARSMSDTLAAYLGNLEETVKARFAELVESEETDSVARAKELLDAFRDKLSNLSFVSETVNKCFAALIGQGKDADAGDLFRTFGDELSDKNGITETLGSKIASLLEADDYGQASSLLSSFEDLNLDVGEAVQSAFEAQLEKGDYEKVAAVLAIFSERIPDKSACEEAVKEKMTALLAEKKDDEVKALYYAVDELNGDALLAETVRNAMKESVQAMDADRINTLLKKFDSYVAPLANAAEDKIAAMIAAEQYEEALDFIGKLDASRFYHDLEDQKYDIACALMDSGEVVRAMQIFTTLNTGLHTDVPELIRECLYQVVQNSIYAIRNGEVFDAETMASLYDIICKLDGYKDIDSYKKATLFVWIYFLLYSQNDPRDYAESFLENVSLTEEEKAFLLEEIILPETGDMVWYTEDQVRHTFDSDRTDALADLMLGIYIPGQYEAATDFIAYLLYLGGPALEILPDFETVRNLWPLRSDMPAFCADGDPLLLFLSGSWTLEGGDDTVILSMEKTEEYNFYMMYDLPMDISNGYLEAMNLGLSAVDEDGQEVGRICDITIVGLDIIEVYNAADQTSYTLVRTAE
ncbi:MAG: hypothetical protein J5496_08135 [Lachnospiraceae bacterium]|nr:hypothetical protein [Lachnospiraceae bacterium]